MIIVHERVHIRHPELDDDDVMHAWKNAYAATARTTDAGVRFLAVGYDLRGRELEMVGVPLAAEARLVYHAMTPPSRRSYQELGLVGGGR